jgi:hypothetical protein
LDFLGIPAGAAGSLGIPGNFWISTAAGRIEGLSAMRPANFC